MKYENSQWFCAIRVNILIIFFKKKYNPVKLVDIIFKSLFFFETKKKKTENHIPFNLY